MNEQRNKTGMPSSVPYIIGNELAERFSYYGMKTILTVFMTKYLMDSTGHLDVMSKEESKFWYHIFVSANYFFPILGALLADIFWGKYRTIIVLSVMYCGGHLALALDETRLGLSLGLTMIALGSGGIKPCVSANVGDQFDESNKHLIAKMFNYFYLAINIGSTISTLLTPVLLREYGPSVAFGLPGALMILATFIFWLGREKYVVVPPAGIKKYFSEVFSLEGLQAIGKLTIIYVFMAVFWALYEQTGSSWVLQADNPLMIKDINLFGYHYTLLPDQLQALNPIFVIILVPLFSLVIYPWLNKFFNLTSLKKMTIGMFLMVICFSVIAVAEMQLQAGKQVSIMWQAVGYLILTMSEVLVYGTGLEFSYTQAPSAMKSLVMGFFMLSISLGSLITALINLFIVNDDGTNKLEGADYFWFFTIVMLVTSIIFIFVAKAYKEKAYIRE